MSVERPRPPVNTRYWENLGVVKAIPEFDIFQAAADVVEQKIIAMASHDVIPAEQKRIHESKGCYCATCLHRVCDKANDAILWALGHTPDENGEVHATKEQWETVRGFWFFVVHTGRGPKIVRGDEVDQERYDQWWEGVSRKQGRDEDPNGLGRFGRLP